MTREPEVEDGRRRRRPASIKDVAAAARVSPTTVSHVLSGNRPVAEETAERVRAVVNRLGYVPASTARSLQAGATNVIGLLVPDITNQFFAELAKGVEDAGHDLGYGVILCNTEFDPAREDHYLQLLRNRFIDGMVYAAGSMPSRDRLASLLGRFPIALADEVVPGLQDETILVTADHRRGGQLIGKHLKELGHRRALAVSGPADLVSSVERIAGFREAFGSDGVTEVEGAFVERSGYDTVADALRKAGRRGRFTAVFAANDLMALGAVAAVEDAGLRVPDDVSVAGFDDIMLAGRVHPSLTTVHQPAYDIGRTAAAQLLQYVHRGEVPPASRHILPVRLKQRASTAPVR